MRHESSLPTPATAERIAHEAEKPPRLDISPHEGLAEGHRIQCIRPARCAEFGAYNSVDSMNVIHGINHPDNVRFRESIFSRHTTIRKTLEAGYMKVARRYSYVEANLALNRDDRRLYRTGSNRYRNDDLNLSWDDDQITRWCERQALHCARVMARMTEEDAALELRETVERYGIEFPDQQADLFGIGPALRRCSDERWWRRKVRVLQARECDEIARAHRLVHNRGQIYCSHNLVNLRTKQRRRNRKVLEQVKATNDAGQEYLLSELSDLGVSNPAIRRSELMVRMRGFEDLAAEQGRVGEFYTITCPSKYHTTHKGGMPNEKWNGATVREAHEYLVRLWSCCRSALDRRGIDVYGFRVAEPHHDGCPHWHLLLFCPADRVAECRSLLARYALDEDYGEWSKESDRFKAISIDPARGSATGYIAKYISKNIDGHRMDVDLYGECAQTSARRIEAWASGHGIRQFQQIGGPSVTVWRELRRVQTEETGIIEKCRQAADAADWAAFCRLMGSGRNQSVKLAYWTEMDVATGEMLGPAHNRYGEPTPEKVFGVMDAVTSVMTRFWTWSIDRVRQSFRPVITRSRTEIDRILGLEPLRGPPGPHLEFCQ